MQCAKANRDKRVRAYFARWMVKPDGEESMSPTIKRREGTITFLKKSKKVKRKDGVKGTLIKNMFCITLGKKTNVRCCVDKSLETTNSRDEAALAPELQLW